MRNAREERIYCEAYWGVIGPTAGLIILAFLSIPPLVYIGARIEPSWIGISFVIIVNIACGQLGRYLGQMYIDHKVNSIFGEKCCENNSK